LNTVTARSAGGIHPLLAHRLVIILLFVRPLAVTFSSPTGAALFVGLMLFVNLFEDCTILHRPSAIPTRLRRRCLHPATTALTRTTIALPLTTRRSTTCTTAATGLSALLFSITARALVALTEFATLTTFATLGALTTHSAFIALTAFTTLATFAALGTKTGRSRAAFAKGAPFPLAAFSRATTRRAVG
jgi:hypothetical protein